MRGTSLLLIAILLQSNSVLAVLPQSVAQNTEEARVVSVETTLPAAKDATSIKSRMLSWIRSRKISNKKTVRPKQTQITFAAAAPVVQQAPALLPVVDQPDIRENHKAIANDVLMSLPARCRGVLQNFHVRYDNPENRGLGGKSTMILTGNVPDDEFRALFIHEFGHLTDLGCFMGNAQSGASRFKDGSTVIYGDDPSVEFYSISWLSENIRREGTDKDFVSGYASWDPFEDFAESFAYFVLQRESFEARALENTAVARKLAWMEKYIGDVQLATGNAYWSGSVPWDVTKLAYSWKAAVAVAQR